MGEYAEMMLDGTCCCQCGQFNEAILDGGPDDEPFEPSGFPWLCPECAEMDDPMWDPLD